MPQFDLETLNRKEEDLISNYTLIPNSTLKVHDKFDNLADVSASFSDPFPEIIINSQTVQVSPNNEKITLSFEADIRDPLADIVNQKADITEVYLEYIDPSTDEDIIINKLLVSKVEELKSKWRPYAHKQIVKTPTIVIPLIGDEISVNLSCINALGNKTVASILIESSPVFNEQDEDIIDNYLFKKYTINNGIGL